MSEFTTTTPVTITLDLHQLTGAIVGAESYEYDTNSAEPVYSDLRGQVVKTVANLIAKDVREAVVESVTKEIKRQVTDIVTETIQSGVYKTNGYGERTGSPTTLRSEIIRVTQESLTKNVGGYNDRKTLLDETIHKVVTSTLTRELTAAVADGKAQVLAVVRAKAAEVIAAKVVGS